MKKSISYWSFPPNLSLKECFVLAKKAGFEAIEVALPSGKEITLDSGKEDLTQVKKEANEAGLELSSLASGLFWDYSLTSNSSETREKAKQIVRKMLEFASYLSVDTILVVPGAVDVFFQPGGEVVSYDVVYERALSALKELAPVAEKYRVNIGVENVWNKFLLSPLEMRDFIDKVGSPFVGAYFDVGNVILTGYPEQWIRILGKRIKKVHLKDFRSSIGNANGFVDLLEGDVNWKEVIAALKEVGYDGYLTAEMMPVYKENDQALIYQTSQALDFILNRK